MLMSRGDHRHATYFAVQAMEKYVRAEIFKRVNATNSYYMDRTRTHNLDELLEFLVEIASGDESVRSMVRKQLAEYVLGNVRFGELHNDLRYPRFHRRRGNFVILAVDSQSADFVVARLDALKSFLASMHLLT